MGSVPGWPPKRGEKCSMPAVGRVGTSWSSRSGASKRHHRPALDHGRGATGRAATLRPPANGADHGLRRDPDVVQTGEAEDDTSPRCVLLHFPRRAFPGRNRGTEASAHRRPAQPAQAPSPRGRTSGGASSSRWRRACSRCDDPGAPGGIRSRLRGATVGAGARS